MQEPQEQPTSEQRATVNQGEPLTLRQIAGIALVIAGALIVQVRRRTG